MTRCFNLAFAIFTLCAPTLAGAAPQQTAPPSSVCPEPFTRQFEITEAISVAAEKAYNACLAMQTLLNSASQNWETINRTITDILTDRVKVPAKRIDSDALLYVEAARDLPAAENRFRENSILTDNLFWDRRIYLQQNKKDFDKQMLDAFSAWESKTMTLLRTHALDPQVFESIVKKSTDMWESEMQERRSVIARARENLNELIAQYNKEPFPPQHEQAPAAPVTAAEDEGPARAGKAH